MPRALFSLENPQQEPLQDSTGPLKDEIDAVFEKGLDSIPDSRSPVAETTDNLLFRRCVFQGLQLMCSNIDKGHFISSERAGTVEPHKRAERADNVCSIC